MTDCRVVHVIPAYGPSGGVESAARSMALRRDLACWFRLVPLAREVALPDLSQVVVPRSRSFGPAAYVRAVREVVALRPDVIVASLWRSLPVALAAKRMLPGTKIALLLHSAFTFHRVDALVHGYAMPRVDAVWADSQAALDARVPRSSRIPTRVISFVTERLGRARPIDAPPTASFVNWGRLAPYKGTDRAIRLVARLVERGIDARFEAWGPDEGHGAELRALCDELGLGDRVVFPGIMDRAKLPSVASRNSFYLSLSRAEGMAMAVVEGMQLGLVPVVTPVGEPKRYCVPHENAVVVDVDRLDAAAEEIAALLSHPAEYARLAAEAARRWAEAPLYADDVCRAACELARRRP